MQDKDYSNKDYLLIINTNAHQEAAVYFALTKAPCVAGSLFIACKQAKHELQHKAMKTMLTNSRVSHMFLMLFFVT